MNDLKPLAKLYALLFIIAFLSYFHFRLGMNLGVIASLFVPFLISVVPSVHVTFLLYRFFVNGHKHE